MADTQNEQSQTAPQAQPSAGNPGQTNTSAQAPQASRQNPQGLERAGASGSMTRGQQDWPSSWVQRFVRDMDRMFEDFGLGSAGLSPWFQRDFSAPGLWAPRLDVTQREGQLVVHVDLPGARQDDINVTLDNGRLTISGQRVDEHEQNERGVVRRERNYGSFRRSIALPDTVDPAGVQATFENGVLEITIPTPQEQAKTRTIPVQNKSAAQETHH